MAAKKLSELPQATDSNGDVVHQSDVSAIFNGNEVEKKLPGAQLHKQVERKIAALLDPPPSGGGGEDNGGQEGGEGGEGAEGQGEGEGQPGDGKPGKPSTGEGKPKPGETWETEKGQQVELVDAMEGDLGANNPKGDGGIIFWNANGEPLHSGTRKIAGKLVRRISGAGEAPLPEAKEFDDAPTVEGGKSDGSDSEAKQPQGKQKPVKVSRKPGEYSNATGETTDSPVKGVVDREIIFTAGCHAVLRDGSVIGPFEPCVAAQSGVEWTWQVDTGDEVEAYRSNGTYHHVEGRESTNDVVRIITAAQAGQL